MLTAFFQLASNFFCVSFGSSADSSLCTASGSYTDMLVQTFSRVEIGGSWEECNLKL
jgi:hypothetical protein